MSQCSNNYNGDQKNFGQGGKTKTIIGWVLGSSLLQLTALKNFVIPHFAHNSTLFGRQWRGCQFTKIISFFRSQHFWSPLYQFLNIFLPLEILLKNVFCSYSWAVFWSLLCHRELKLTTKPFTGRTLRARCKILAFEVWACTESKILR